MRIECENCRRVFDESVMVFVRLESQSPTPLLVTESSETRRYVCKAFCAECAEKNGLARKAGLFFEELLKPNPNMNPIKKVSSTSAWKELEGDKKSPVLGLSYLTKMRLVKDLSSAQGRQLAYEIERGGCV